MVKAGEAVLVLVDIQGGLASAMPAGDLGWRARCSSRGRPVRSASHASSPGSTRAGLATRWTHSRRGRPHSRGQTAFDALSERGFCERLEATGRRTVIIAGIEAHICVTQTALSCVGAGYRVHVVADAVCSRRPADRDTALERLRSAGVVVTTSESVLYEALGDAGAPAFREVLRLVKECRPAR